MKLDLISSQCFAMFDANQSASILTKLKTQATRDVFLYEVFLKRSQSLKNICERVQYLRK